MYFNNPRDMGLRGDQIDIFLKILNEYESMHRNIFFSLKKDRTRGHVVTVVKDQCRLYIRKYPFSKRTID